MWIIFYGYIITIVFAETSIAKFLPIFSKYDPVIQKIESKRYKRQFGSSSQVQGFSGSTNSEFSGNTIFFDNDNAFNDFVQPNRPRANLIGTTSRPQGPTTVAIPGMGTTQSACETRCMTTPQYDPVCGDNNVTYMNLARFQCAVRCGRNVRIVAYRACPRV